MLQQTDNKVLSVMEDEWKKGISLKAGQWPVECHMEPIAHSSAHHCIITLLWVFFISILVFIIYFFIVRSALITSLHLILSGWPNSLLDKQF